MRFFTRGTPTPPSAPVFRLVPPKPTEEQFILASIYLYVSWRYVTKQLTTEQKNMWADAVDAVHRWYTYLDGEEYEPIERWWED